MDALTELTHMSFGGFLLTTRFPDFRTEQDGGFIDILQRGKRLKLRRIYSQNHSPQQYIFARKYGANIFVSTC